MVPLHQAGLLDGLQDYKQYQLSVVCCIQCNPQKKNGLPMGGRFVLYFLVKSLIQIGSPLLYRFLPCDPLVSSGRPGIALV